MDGDASAPDRDRIKPVAGILAPLEGDVVDAGTDHGSQHHQGQEIGNEGWLNASSPAEPGGQAEAQQHGHGDEQAVPAQGKGAQLENQGPRGGEGGKHAAQIKPSAA